MRFWDTSALVPLCLDQPRTAASRLALKADADMVVWWGTSIECTSAIARLHRDGELSTADEREARRTLDALRHSWSEIQPCESVREQAVRLLRLHPLRAADALQLAAALEWSGASAPGVFVCYDERLNAAAWREGFSPPI